VNGYVTKKELHDAFAEGRSIESIEPSRLEGWEGLAGLPGVL
jgi:hypothetical protein